MSFGLLRPMPPTPQEGNVFSRSSPNTILSVFLPQEANQPICKRAHALAQHPRLVGNSAKSSRMLLGQDVCGPHLSSNERLDDDHIEGLLALIHAVADVQATQLFMACSSL